MTCVSENDYLIETFNTEKKLLLYCAFYPNQKKCWFILLGIFVFLYSWTEFLSMFALLFIERDWIKISETLHFCMTQVAFLSKLTMFIFKKNRMLAIENILKLPLSTSLTESEKEIVEGYMLEIKYLARIYRVLCAIVVTFYGLFPFIDEDPDHMLPFPGWFPVDVKKHQFKLVLAQTCGIGMGALYNSTLDLLPTILISLGSAKFDILKKRLENSTKVDACPNKNAIIVQRLKYCVKYHHMLLKYVKQVEELFNFGIFVQFAASVIVICMTGFQLLVVSVKSAQFILLISYFATMTCQIILYCWYGNELMYRSMGVAEACYMSNWNDCSKEVCTYFYIIMERGKRPVILTAEKLFSLTMGTLMTIMKSSYSYFAVLQRLYSKDSN